MYNEPVQFPTKLAMIALLLPLLAATAARAGDGQAPAPAANRAACMQAAADCCGCITAACLPLKYCLPDCFPPHKRLAPCIPDAPCLCIEPVCHKPLTPCTPEAPCFCLPAACHKPLTPVVPVEPCRSECAGTCAGGDAAGMED